MDTVIAIVRVPSVVSATPGRKPHFDLFNGLFLVACASLGASVGVRQRGASHVAPTDRSGAQGTSDGIGKIGWRGELKGTFQGEQRPAETDPSQDNRWRLR